MKTAVVFAACGLSLFVLAGCGQQSDAPLPTLMPTALPAEAATATTIPTQAPTSTPLVRATLPPTWTPSPASAQEQPTETPLTANQEVNIPAEKPTLEACGPFREDRSRYNPQFVAGTDVMVAWVPATGAPSYRVNVVDESGEEFFADYTADSTYTFKADLFERGKRYGWNVYPMDALGQQMCISVGGELFPQ
ncbi:MAG: hypothetical protein HZC41_17365 [Chloroflexi bacterium]|nr:hypothetical protein [Chloroflexota bacterium]